MPGEPSAVALLEDLARVFDELSVAWFLFGAQAAATYGSTRVTTDVDVTVDLGAVAPADLLDRLASAGFTSRVSDPLELLELSFVVPLRHQVTGMDLDLVVAGSGLERGALERSRRIRFGTIDVPVIAPEDLIVMKVLAGRPRDLEDCSALIRSLGETLNGDQVRDLLGELEEALAVDGLLLQFEELVRCATRTG